MQKKLFIPVLIFALTLSISTLWAQPFVGLGLGGGSRINRACADLRGGYQFNDKIRLAANFHVFGNNSYQSVWYNSNFRITSFNIDGHYTFDVGQELFNIYALGGIDFTFARFERYDYRYKGQYHPVHNRYYRDVDSYTTIYPGVNVGGGMQFDLKVIHPYFEMKYVISEFDQLVATVGLHYYFKK